MKQILLMIAAVALVGCGKSLTEEELIGVYEIKAYKVALFANGKCLHFKTKNGEISVVDGTVEGGKSTWKIVGKEVHVDTLIFRIEKNGDLTSVAQIVRGKRKAYPKEEQLTFKKSNEGVEALRQAGEESSPVNESTLADESRLTAELLVAERGDVVAQNNLGLMYGSGDGVPKDLKEAAKWFRKAAEQGNALAQINLGLMYLRGKGADKDDKEAVKWLRKAAEQGIAAAQLYLGLMYGSGDGVPEDLKEATKWFRKAAEQGNAMAQYSLGVMYGEGSGVLQDDVTAYAWWDISAANGQEKARRFKDLAAKELTAEEIAKAEALI